jgi:CBS domain-containing protein
VRHTTVAEVMTSTVLSVAPDATFTEIADLLYTAAVHAVPVIDNDHALIGVVSEDDLLRTLELADADRDHRHHLPRLKPRRPDRDAITARELMTASVVTITADASAARAARTMRQRGLSWLPVIDADDQLVGVLSRSDLLAVFLRNDGEIRKEIIDDVLRRALLVDPAGIDVEVDDGVVTLTGELELHADTVSAVRLAERVEGVVAVVDRLTHRTDERRDDSLVAPMY